MEAALQAAPARRFGRMLRAPCRVGQTARLLCEGGVK
jgi:hypothetical protein